MAAQYIEPMTSGRIAGMPTAWPAPCPVCLAWHVQQPCPACKARFQPQVPRCVRCALAVPPGSTVCGACVLSPPPFTRAVASVTYAFPWDRLITRYKFAGDLSLLPALSGLLIDSVAAEPDIFASVDWVLPMPVSPRRLRERGFNQAWELARHLSGALHLVARHDLLLRWRETEHQTSLSRDDRRANLRGAFMSAPGARAQLRGTHVALVDDVMTTGASAAEAACTLLEAGAARVDVWLLARTPEAPGAQAHAAG